MGASKSKSEDKNFIRKAVHSVIEWIGFTEKRDKDNKDDQDPINNKDKDTKETSLLSERQDLFEMIVAIDFGTYGTGVGFAKFNEEDVYIERGWSDNKIAGTKNRTDILLSHDGECIAFGDKALNMLSQ